MHDKQCSALFTNVWILWTIDGSELPGSTWLVSRIQKSVKRGLHYLTCTQKNNLIQTCNLPSSSCSCNHMLQLAWVNNNKSLWLVIIIWLNHNNHVLTIGVHQWGGCITAWKTKRNIELRSLDATGFWVTRVSQKERWRVDKTSFYIRIIPIDPRVNQRY